MNTLEAKKILLLYRPDSADALNDPELAEALQKARHDAELGSWLENHNRFQIALRQKFSEIPVPKHLKETILAETKIIRPAAWWPAPVWTRVAAAIALLIVFGFGVNAWKTPRVPDRFADYQSRMVRSTLREYQMDLVTNDLNQIRQLMSSRGAPSDFHLTQGLARLQLTGGGVLRWRNHPVTMVCFNRGDNQMLFLFVMNRSAVKDPPGAMPALGQIKKMATANWTDGDKTYLLAGPEERDFLQKYL